MCVCVCVGQEVTDAVSACESGKVTVMATDLYG